MLRPSGKALDHVATLEDATKVRVIRVGQHHIYTVHIRYIWQENHQIYGHIRCIYTVLAIPKRN